LHLSLDFNKSGNSFAIHFTMGSPCANSMSLGGNILTGFAVAWLQVQSDMPLMVVECCYFVAGVVLFQSTIVM